MQASDMMCRYESRALSASLMGNKSFRFRISALIWSRRALDAPLVERYIVPCCCGETHSEETRGRKKNSSVGERELSELCCSERRSLEPSGGFSVSARDRWWRWESCSGALLDFHISRLGGLVFSPPSPLRKEKKGSRKPSVLCPLVLSPPQRPARVAGRPPDGWMGSAVSQCR